MMKQFIFKTLIVFIFFVPNAFSSWCDSGKVSFVIARYMEQKSDSSIFVGNHFIYAPFQEAVSNNLRINHRNWMKLDTAFEIEIAQVLRSNLIGGEKNERPLHRLPFPVQTKLDSSGIQYLLVFYIFNDNDHAESTSWRAQFTKTKMDNDFQDEEIYYFISVFDIKNQTVLYEWRDDLGNLLKGEKNNNPSISAIKFVEKAIQQVEKKGCQNDSDYTKYTDIENAKKVLGKIFLCLGILIVTVGPILLITIH